MDPVIIIAIALSVSLFYMGHYLGYRDAVCEFCDALKDWSDEDEEDRTL